MNIVTKEYEYESFYCKVHLYYSKYRLLAK